MGSMTFEASMRDVAGTMLIYLAFNSTKRVFFLYRIFKTSTSQNQILETCICIKIEAECDTTPATSVDRFHADCCILISMTFDSDQNCFWQTINRRVKEKNKDGYGISDFCVIRNRCGHFSCDFSHVRNRQNKTLWQQCWWPPLIHFLSSPN